MTDKTDVSSFQISHSKIWVNGEKYFSLFEKYIPELDADKSVLVYSIDNLDFILKLMQAGNGAKFWIFGCSDVNDALRSFGFDFTEVIEDSDSKKYNIPDMNFDCIIMNPPYERNLHLKILAEAIKHLKDEKSVCVNLSPTPYLTSVRNIWDEKTISRHSKVEAFKHLTSLEPIKNGIELFSVGIQQHLGIQTYVRLEHDFSIDKYAKCSLPKDLVKKIMKACCDNCIDRNHGSGKFKLNMSAIHGHVNCPDFLNIMALTYERQLRSKGTIEVWFEAEQDRHDFYDFWMSPLGKLVTSLWKVDTNVMFNYIPYLWFKTDEDFYTFFKIAPEEQQIIKDTMEKYK